jgi:ADP-ribose pyrophosphatase YjhB (NUDIX family)
MTVAAVIEDQGQFLLVRERADGQYVYNQPAGHLEPNEGLTHAVVREVYEEAHCHFIPESILGVYRWIHPGNGETHVRVAFAGRLDGAAADAPSDDAVVSCHWYSYDDIEALRSHMRSPLVMGCIDDFIAGRRYPLELLRELV